MPIFLGLDCGGSSSRALALDEGGACVFQGQSGSANLLATPEWRLKSNLASATRDCPDVDFVCGCFAGLVSPSDGERARLYLRELFPKAKIRTEPDHAAALAAAPPGTDVCVIAGTGSLVCSRTPAGLVRSGGRGYLLGDEGSAFQYGRDALRAFLDQGTDASPELRAAVAAAFHTEDEGEIVSSLYRSARVRASDPSAKRLAPSAPEDARATWVSPQATLARLAKVLAVDAKAGRAYALESLERNSGLLAQVISRHVHRYLADRSTIQLGLTGGLWQISPHFKLGLVQKLSETMHNVSINAQRISKPPVYGAAMLAREMAIGN